MKKAKRKRSAASSRPGTAAPVLIGPVMADVAGLALTAEDREVLRHPMVGGLILFARNYRDRTQLGELCREIAALKKPRLLVAVDHEGGRVQRFREGFTRGPAMRTFGMQYQDNPRQARAAAARWGRTLGRELAAFGIDLCFAPVLDRDTGESEVIGDRAFSGDPATIVALASAFSRGLAAAGLKATGKHFPGHGAVTADSHHALPVDRRSWDEIRSTDLVPFAQMIRKGIPSLMLAHVRYAAVDETPASLSRHWIQQVLRQDLRYDGALFCDDLSMGGAAVIGSMADRARLALAAGNDMILVCNDRPGTWQVLEALKRHRISPESSRRLRKLFRSRPAARR